MEEGVSIGSLGLMAWLFLLAVLWLLGWFLGLEFGVLLLEKRL